MTWDGPYFGQAAGVRLYGTTHTLLYGIYNVKNIVHEAVQG